MKNRVLITGAGGFIGHHLIEGILKGTDWSVVVLDKLNPAGDLNRITDLEIWPQEGHRVKFVHHDLRAPINDTIKKHIGKFNVILHLAANSDVDDSIIHPVEVAYDNVIGTVNILEFFRQTYKEIDDMDGDETLPIFLYFSTDEVYGPAPEGVNYKEGSRHNPSNPYSAGKAGAEDFCRAYANTYHLPIMITNTMNVFGERQAPTKFIPKVINAIEAGDTVTIHSDKTKTKAGSRYYIHARNVAQAIIWLVKERPDFLSTQDEQQGQFNIVGDEEVDNLTLAEIISGVMEIPLKYEMTDFHGSRPGHDLRYALDGSKLKKLGFSYPKNFRDSLEKTIKWTLRRPEWR